VSAQGEVLRAFMGGLNVGMALYFAARAGQAWGSGNTKGLACHGLASIVMLALFALVVS